ncbi:MAG TPA: MarR family transcriptional regulator [Gaiellaceae bacterium]|nr:MarR family transcriptional regulator [Gaiellaceae bacterium]
MAKRANGSIPLERVIQIAEFRANLRAFLRHNEHSCRRWGLTPQRFMLLLAVKGAPDGTEQQSITDLANRLQLSRNTVTELCVRAEEAGLLTREQSTRDQRVVCIRLTAEGERRLAGVIRENDDYRDELVAAFTNLTDSFAT